MSALKTLAEMERIRMADAEYRAKQDIEPEPVKYEPWADFRVYRASQGNIKGLFKVVQVMTTGWGKKATWTEKVLAEGVDMHIVQCSIRDAISRRLNARSK